MRVSSKNSKSFSSVKWRATMFFIASRATPLSIPTAPAMASARASKPSTPVLFTAIGVPVSMAFSNAAASFLDTSPRPRIEAASDRPEASVFSAAFSPPVSFACIAA